MKSKFLLIMIFIFSLIGINAFAETFEINLENKPEFILIKEYDGDVITKLQCVKPDADKNTVTFESDSEKISALALYGNETKTVDFVKIEQEIINPETPEKEENIKDNNSDNKKEFPEVYDIEKDAVRALLVVSSVSSAFKDGENITELKLFLHGEERIIYLPEDITIQNCPEFYSDLNNQPATSLKKGDVIKLRASLSGSITDLSLIFRPTKDNPIFSENDYGSGFSGLFSENGIVAGDATYKICTPDTGIIKTGYGYAFGVIKDRENYELQLSDINGNVLTFEIKDGAIVYKVDREEKFNVDNGVISSIRRSSGAKKAFDDDGVFKEWTKDANYGYAFLRTIDGEATEIIIYENY